jgi:alkylation response protein AidB-like acyl-CoA dehydrogenase
MDFSLSEDQEAIADLARQILEDQATPDRLKEVEAAAVNGGDGVDRKAWSELAKANLVGLGLPEAVGGSGLGFLAPCAVLYQVGRTVAPVPFLASAVMAGLTLAEFGTDEQRQRLLPGIANGERIGTAALVEPGAEPNRPATSATADGDRWRLEGTKVCVPAGMAADLFLVPARTGEGELGVFVVEAGASGVTRLQERTTSGLPEARLELAGVVVGAADVVGSPSGGAAVLDWLMERAIVGSCITMAGVCEAAVRLTAEYTKTREQFDRPIANFQAVGQRAAEAYIDTEAVRLTAWQAAWRLDTGAPAAAEVAVAKFWAADGGQRAVHAAQHLHGGVGVDRDYPLHRYFLWAKQLELALGGATASLLRLGGMLASEPV